MCTSFALKNPQPLVAMNFDLAARPIALSMPNPHQLLILQSEQGQWLPAIGMTSTGCFMNVQMLPATAAGAYRRSKDVVHMMRIFEQLLADELSIAELETLLQQKQIVNVPNHSVHSLLRDTHGQIAILEPGQSSLIQHDQALIQTNFSLHSPAIADLAQQPSADRFLNCQQLLNVQQEPSVEQAFAILAATAQATGDFPTQLAIVFEPAQQAVWLQQPSQPALTWRFSFVDQRLVCGERVYQLNKKRLLISSLVA